MDTTPFWGYHLSLDCGGCDYDKITSYDNVYNFVKQLVKDIDMVPYGEPTIPNFGHGNKAGFSLNQWIMTSNITGHFVNENNEIYLDVFSCKPFTKETVVNLVRQYFNNQTIVERYFERQAPLPKI